MQPAIITNYAVSNAKTFNGISFFIDNRYKLMIQMCLRDKSKSSLNENLDVNLYNVLPEMRHSVHLGKLKGISSYKYSGYFWTIIQILLVDCRTMLLMVEGSFLSTKFIIYF